MREIILRTHFERVDFFLVDHLRSLFPECEIKVLFEGEAEPLRLDGREEAQGCRSSSGAAR